MNTQGTWGYTWAKCTEKTKVSFIVCCPFLRYIFSLKACHIVPMRAEKKMERRWENRVERGRKTADWQAPLGPCRIPLSPLGPYRNPALPASAAITVRIVALFAVVTHYIFFSSPCGVTLFFTFLLEESNPPMASHLFFPPFFPLQSGFAS